MKKIYLLLLIVFFIVCCANEKITQSNTISKSSSLFSYSVKFDSNGGSGFMNTTQVVSNNTFKIPECFFIAPNEMKFDSWNTKSDGTGRKIEPNSQTKLADKSCVVILYAQWIPIGEYKIIYKNIDEADNSLNQQFFNKQDNVVLANPTHQYLTFVGWFTARTNGVQISGWQANEKLSDVTVWARWIDKNLVIDNRECDKSALTPILTKTTDFICNQSSGAFLSCRDSVCLKPFAIGKYEVTQQLYAEVMKSTPSYNVVNADTSASGITEKNKQLRPVDNVSWYQAIAFCNKLSLLLGKTPCYTVKSVSDWSNLEGTAIPTRQNDDWDAVVCNFDCDGYRLPTELEWECAARGGVFSFVSPWAFMYSGSDKYDDVCWYNSISRNHSWEVGLKEQNFAGTFDMSGNVREWCWDWFSEIDEHTSLYGSETGTKRVFRGGSYYFEVDFCLVSYRDITCVEPSTNSNHLGFRIAQSIMKKKI